MSRPTPQEIQDIRDQAKIDKAYEDSLTTMVPDKYEAGAGRGRVNPPIPKNARYAKGGVTRADGCITKGHTRGRMV